MSDLNLPIAPWPEERPRAKAPESQAKREKFTVRFNERTYEFWIEPVGLRTLGVAPDRQRTLSEFHVERMVEEFNPLAVIIYASVRPDGSKVCVGGMHCATAALRLGFESWPAAFHCERLDEQAESELYEDLLTIKPPTEVEKVNAAIHAHDAETMAHLQLLRTADRDWARSRGKDNWNCFTTLGATRDVQKKAGIQGLIRQLRFANECWHGQPEVCNGEVVRAVHLLFRDWRTVHRKFPEERIISVFRDVSLKKLSGQISIAPYHRNSSTHGRAGTLSRIMAEYYNEHMQGFKLYHISALETPPGPATAKDKQ